MSETYYNGAEKKASNLEKPKAGRTFDLALPEDVLQRLGYGSIESDTKRKALQAVARFKSRLVLRDKQIDSIVENGNNRDICERIEKSEVEIEKLYKLITDELTNTVETIPSKSLHTENKQEQGMQNKEDFFRVIEDTRIFVKSQMSHTQSDNLGDLIKKKGSYVLDLLSNAESEHDAGSFSEEENQKLIKALKEFKKILTPSVVPPELKISMDTLESERKKGPAGELNTVLDVFESELGKGPIGAEMLPSLDTHSKGWRRHFMHTGSGVLNAIAAAGVLFSASTFDASKDVDVKKVSFDVTKNLENTSDKLVGQNIDKNIEYSNTRPEPKFTKPIPDKYAQKKNIEGKTPSVVLDSSPIEIGQTPNISASPEEMSSEIDTPVVYQSPEQPNASDADVLPEVSTESSERIYTFKKGDTIWDYLEGDVDGIGMSSVLTALPENKRDAALAFLRAELLADNNWRQRVGIEGVSPDIVNVGTKINGSQLDSLLEEVITKHNIT